MEHVGCVWCVCVCIKTFPPFYIVVPIRYFRVAVIRKLKEKHRNVEGRLERPEIIAEYSRHDSQAYAPKTRIGVFIDRGSEQYVVKSRFLTTFQGNVVHFSVVRFTSAWLGSLQRSSVHFSVVRFTSAWFGSLQCSSVHFSVIWFTSAWFGSLQRNSVHFSIVRFTSVWFGSLQRDSVHFSVIRFTSA